MKKIVSILLTLVMALALIPTQVFAADPYQIVSVSPTTVKVGDDVSITVTLPEISETAGSFTVALAFDKDLLEITALTTPAKITYTEYVDGEASEDSKRPEYNTKDLASNSGIIQRSAADTFNSLEVAGYAVIKATFKAKAAGTASFSFNTFEITKSDGSTVILVGKSDLATPPTVTIEGAATVCEHTNKQKVDAKEPTCTAAGNSAYWVCPDCEKYFSDEACTAEIEYLSWVKAAQGHNFKGKMKDNGNGTHSYKCTRCDVYGDPADHSGAGDYKNDAEKGQHYQECGCGVKVYSSHRVVTDAPVMPTCTESGLTEGKHCADCNAVIVAQEIIPARHIYEHHNAKAATCTEDGNNEYWICTECFQVFKADKTTTTTVADETIPAAHTLSGWKHDETNHWKVCTKCTIDTQFEKAPHVYDNDDDMTCNTCDYNRTPAACQHETVIPVPAVAATCAAEGNNAYYKCNDCGALFSDQACTQPTTADEMKTQKNPENHVGETEVRGAKDATCTEAGYTGDTYCTVCGDKIAEGRATEAKGHGQTEVKYDAEYHWHECSVCHETVGQKAPHVYENDEDMICDTCKYNRSCTHSSIVPEEGTAATCTVGGTKDHYKCENCGLLFIKDDTGNYVEATADDLLISAKGHGEPEVKNAKEATCTENGYTGDTYCTVCGDKIADGRTIQAKGHGETEVKNAKEATCTENGYTGDTCCTVCGDKIADGRTIQAKGHTPVTDEAVPATCTTDGKTAGSHCSVCGAVITAQETVKAIGHKWNDGEVTKEPTCDKAGVKTYTCTKCSETKTESIPATGHDYGRDGKCTECGKRKPGSNTPTTPTTPTTGKDAKSPTTGDAGILLYAGMSVMSLMGMGWVAKKRHD